MILSLSSSVSYSLVTKSRNLTLILAFKLNQTHTHDTKKNEQQKKWKPNTNEQMNTNRQTNKQKIDDAECLLNCKNNSISILL